MTPGSPSEDRQPPQEGTLPLVVDLDDALSPAQASIEALAGLAMKQPQALPSALLAIARGRPAVKVLLAQRDAYSASALPLREDVLEYLRAEHARGRTLHLITSAHQSVADAVCANLPLFASGRGTSEGLEMKGKAKVAHLRRLFPDGFDYLGSPQREPELARAAKGFVAVGSRPSSAADNTVHAFTNPAVRARDWIRALRVHQWSKNALLLVPLMLAHEYTQIDAFLACIAGMMALNLVASGTYLLNDLSDVAYDRAHPIKRNRPIARAIISARTAIAVALGLIACGLAGALVLSPAFASLVVAYLILTLAYSYRLKSVPIVDVFVLGILFTLRILMGTALIGQPVAPWLLAFSLFFFISLSMAKRQSELVSAKNRGHAGPIAGRGYNTADIPLTLIIGVCSSFAAVLLLFLYVVNDAYPVEAYSQPQWLWIIGFIIFLWSMRVWLLSHRGQLNEDPVLFAIRDRESWMMGFAMVVCFALAVS